MRIQVIIGTETTSLTTELAVPSGAVLTTEGMAMLVGRLQVALEMAFPPRGDSGHWKPTGALDFWLQPCAVCARTRMAHERYDARTVCPGFRPWSRD